ncbi:MAG: ribosomal protection tetracycline resistance protein, partial [Actinomycetota bacterium]|nr:ribosomal protection tetracycline resistance protein [Actinomycetota bacterium]
MRTLNLGILAHVNAGKTSLTERLLFAAGVIDAVGSVDAGSTQTDSLLLERQRGITIKTAVATFAVGDVSVNLIDTPGHPDFIAEVERALSVLDGAVLVVSAVEGVQAQTRVLMRTLQRLRIPTLVFVNKVDRAGADDERVLRSIARRLTDRAVPMGRVDAIGTRDAAFEPFDDADPQWAVRLTELLAEGDDALLAAYVEDETVPVPDLLDRLAAQTAAAAVHPVFLGSAITGAGVDELTAGIARLLPTGGGDPDAPLSGAVFKVERGPSGERIAFVRLHAGTLRTRDRVSVAGGREEKVTAVEVFGAGEPGSVTAGQIAKVWGLGSVRVGDVIGCARPAAERWFAPPTLETVVAPVRRRDRGALFVALTQLAEQDPFIELRRDPVRRELSLSLYGEVQKEVIQATLAVDFGVDVTFRESSTICIERVLGSGAAYEVIGTPSNPFLATIGLRIDPAPVGAGVDFRLEVELGSLPFAFMKAIEETVAETLRQGRHGWQLPDCVVTLTHSGFWPRQSRMHGTFDKSMSSTAGDFRNLVPLILLTALNRAGTQVCEPVHRFEIELPADTVGPLFPVLSRLDAVPGTPAVAGALCTLEGEIPAARVHELAQLLPGLTRGEG